jgi:hypothetical protein
MYAITVYSRHDHRPLNKITRPVTKDASAMAAYAVKILAGIEKVKHSDGSFAINSDGLIVWHYGEIAVEVGQTGKISYAEHVQGAQQIAAALRSALKRELAG